MKAKSRRRIVILGATGYLGRAVEVAVRTAGEKDELLLLRGIQDMDKQSNEVCSRDVVINCVGYYGTDEGRLQSANVEHALRAAVRTAAGGARFIHVSSSAVFDAIPSGRLDESLLVRPGTAYGRSKAEGEARVAENLPTACIVRPAKLFGGDDPRARLHALFRHVQKGRRLPLPEHTPLFANFIWVRDAGKALAQVATSPSEQQVVHLATPTPWPSFAAAVGEAVGVPIQPLPRFAERGVRLAALALRQKGRRLPRRLERLAELWDEREFIDSRSLLPTDSVNAGLAEIARRIR